MLAHGAARHPTHPVQRLMGDGHCRRLCRVLANNDVPTGAARIPLEALLDAGWEGCARATVAAAPAAAVPLLLSSAGSCVAATLFFTAMAAGGLSPRAAGAQMRRPS